MHLTISISQSHNPFVNCNYKSIFKCAHHLRLSGLYENRNRCNNAGKDRARNSNGRREIAGKIRGQRTPQRPARVESFESAVLNRFHRLAPTFTPSRDPSRRRLCEGMRVRASLVGPVSFRFCLLFAVCQLHSIFRRRRPLCRCASFECLVFVRYFVLCPSPFGDVFTGAGSKFIKFFLVCFVR